MIDRVFYAITQEQRYYLNGALLSLKNRQIELVSTDGHRLSYTKKAEDGLKLDKEIERHRGQEDAERDPEVRGRDGRVRPRREQPLLQGRAEDAHLPGHREQVPELPGGHPQGQPRPAGRSPGRSWPTPSGASRSSRPSGPRGSSSRSKRTSCGSSPRTRRSARPATGWPSNTRGRTWRSASTPSICSISSRPSGRRRSSSRSRTRTAPSCSSRRPKRASRTSTS